MTPEEILEGAMQVIERDGWHQGSLCKSEGDNNEVTEQESATSPVCALGAVWRFATGHAVNCFADPYTVNALRDAVYAAARKLEGLIQVRHIAPWNDNPATTKEDVLLLLKKAAHDG
jgi:hypothetical protein